MLAEETLKETRSWLEATLVAGEVSTWIRDIQSDRLVGGSNLVRMFGLSAKETSGAPLSTFLASLHLIDNLLDIARVKSGKVQLKKERLSCVMPFPVR